MYKRLERTLIFINFLVRMCVCMCVCVYVCVYVCVCVGYVCARGSCINLWVHLI